MVEEGVLATRTTVDPRHGEMSFETDGVYEAGRGGTWNKSIHTLTNIAHNTRKVENLNNSTGQPTNKLSQNDPGAPNNSSHRSTNRNWTKGAEHLAGASVRPVKIKENAEESILHAPRRQTQEVLVGKSVRPIRTEEYIPVAETPQNIPKK